MNYTIQEIRDFANSQGYFSETDMDISKKMLKQLLQERVDLISKYQKPLTDNSLEDAEHY